MRRTAFNCCPLLLVFLIFVGWQLPGFFRLTQITEKKVALEVSGQIRSLEQVVDSWELFLLPNLRKLYSGIDVFLACVDEKEALAAQQILRRLSFGHIYTTIRTDLPPKLKRGHIPLLHSSRNDWRVQAAPGVLPLRRVEAWLWQLTGIASAAALRRSVQYKKHTRYHLVIRLRFDLEFLAPLPIHILFHAATKKNLIYLPFDQSHGGFNDKFALSTSPEAMDTYASFLAFLATEPAAVPSHHLRASASSFSCPLSPAESRQDEPALLPPPPRIIQVERCLAWFLTEIHRTTIEVQPRKDIRLQVRREDGALSPY